MVTQIVREDRKSYARPQLVKHGKVESLTQTFDQQNGSCPIHEIDVK